MKRTIYGLIAAIGLASGAAQAQVFLQLPAAATPCASGTLAGLQLCGRNWFNANLLLADPAGYNPAYTVMPKGWVNVGGTPTIYTGTVLLVYSTVNGAGGPISTYMWATSGPPKGGYVQGFNYGNVANDSEAFILDARIFSPWRKMIHATLGVTEQIQGSNDSDQIYWMQLALTVQSTGTTFWGTPSALVWNPDGAHSGSGVTTFTAVAGVPFPMTDAWGWSYQVVWDPVHGFQRVASTVIDSYGNSVQVDSTGHYTIVKGKPGKGTHGGMQAPAGQPLGSFAVNFVPWDNGQGINQTPQVEIGDCIDRKSVV